MLTHALTLLGGLPVGSLPARSLDLAVFNHNLLFLLLRIVPIAVLVRVVMKRGACISLKHNAATPYQLLLLLLLRRYM